MTSVNFNTQTLVGSTSDVERLENTKQADHVSFLWF